MANQMVVADFRSLSTSKLQAPSGQQSAFWPLDCYPARAKLDLLSLNQVFNHILKSAIFKDYRHKNVTLLAVRSIIINEIPLAIE